MSAGLFYVLSNDTPDRMNRGYGGRLGKDTILFMKNISDLFFLCIIAVANRKKSTIYHSYEH